MKAQRPWRLRAWRLILTFFCVYHGRARGGMSLFPSAVQAGTLNTIEDLRQYYDIDDSAWSALPSMSLVGQPDLRIFSALPSEALVENIMLTRFGSPPASLTPAHAVQMRGQL